MLLTINFLGGASKFMKLRSKRNGESYFRLAKDVLAISMLSQVISHQRTNHPTVCEGIE